MFAAHCICNVGDIEWALWNKNCGCTTSDSCMSGNPPRVTAHYFHHHHTIMAFCCGVETIYCIGCNLYGGIKPETYIGTHNVVVNCFGNSHHCEPNVGMQFRCDPQRAITTNYNQGIDSHLAQIFFYTSWPVGIVIRTSSSRAQNCAATWQSSRQCRHVQFH